MVESNPQRSVQTNFLSTVQMTLELSSPTNLYQRTQETCLMQNLSLVQDIE